MPNKIEIRKDQFFEYERVRMSGVTNMYDISAVEMLTYLNRNEILYIMKHYSDLKEKCIS